MRVKYHFFKKIFILFITFILILDIFYINFAISPIYGDNYVEDGKFKKMYGENYFFDIDNNIVKNSFIIAEDKLYRSDENGRLVEGWYVDDNGNKYFFDEDKQSHAAYKYIGNIKGVLYYFNDDGKLYRSGEVDGYKRINDTNFFVNNEGVIFDRVDFVYKIVDAEILKPLIGIELTYSNIKLYLSDGNDMFLKYKYKVKDAGKNVSVLDTNYNIDSAIYTYKNSNGISLCVIGDSYATAFAMYTKCDFSYIIHPGYNTQYIRAELLDLVKDYGDLTYFFLFIGPNDLILGRSPYEFENDLRYIINYIKSKGHKVILSSYLGATYQIYNYTSFDYDLIMLKVARELSCEYIESKDLDAKYKRDVDDPIHPPKEFYTPLYDRVVSYVITDWSGDNK